MYPELKIYIVHIHKRKTGLRVTYAVLILTVKPPPVWLLSKGLYTALLESIWAFTGGNASLDIEALFDGCICLFESSSSNGVDDEDGLVFVSDDDGLVGKLI